MKLPIPNDWLADGWMCVNVQWPDSPQWVGILSGLLTAIMRGRLWDETTGSVIDVQQIGYEIHDRNFPFVFCSEGGGSESDESIEYRVISGFEEMADIMSLCGYNPKAFKVENGALWVRDFCGEWVQIGAINTPPPDDGITPGVYDPDPDYNTFYPCGMARAVGDLMSDLADYIWSESDSTLPIFMVAKAQNHVGLDLNNLWTLNAVTQANIMKGVVIGSWGTMNISQEDMHPADWDDYLVCAIKSQFGSDDGAFDVDSLFSAIGSAIDARWPLAADAENVFMRNYWSHIKDAIGKGNVADVANSGALDDTAVCDCEAASMSYGPTSSGWYLGPLHTETGIPVPLGGAYPDWGYAQALEVVPHDVYGVFFQSFNLSRTFGTFKPTNPPAPFDSTPDFEMNKTNSESFYKNQAYLAAGNGAANELINVFGLQSSQYTNNNVIAISDIINTPIASAGDKVGFSMSMQKDAGGSGTMSFRWAWLHNTNSPSHS